MFGFTRRSAPVLDPEQRFALATGAILTEMNGQRHDCLLGDEPSGSLKRSMRETLADYWGVENREQLLEILHWLSEEGHRAEYEALAAVLAEAHPIGDPLDLLSQEALAAMGPDEREVFRKQAAFIGEHGRKHPSILAWDLCRLVSVARFGAAAGYLSETEAWKWILDAARELNAAFGSWRELGANYMAGRRYWAQEGNAEASTAFERTYAALVDERNEASPWNRISWSG